MTRARFGIRRWRSPHCSRWRRPMPRRPDRAIPTGRASRSRCRSFRWRRSGRVRRWIRNRTTGGRISRWPISCMTLAQRRVPIEQAQDRIHAFAQQAAEQKQPKLLELLAGLFSVLDDERGAVIVGLDRFGVRQKELATAIRERQRKAAGDAGRSRRRCERGQPDGAAGHVGGGGLPGPASGVELRLRRAGQDRTAAVRAGTDHPAGAGLTGAAQAHSAACGRGTGVRASSGRCCAVQPSVPSGYQATCV